MIFPFQSLFCFHPLSTSLFLIFLSPLLLIYQSINQSISRSINQLIDHTNIHQVALVTDQMSFNPLKKFDVMPQIVVGTPKALESALTKVSFSLVLSFLILSPLISSHLILSPLLSSLLLSFYLISYYPILFNCVMTSIITHPLHSFM